MSNRYRSLTDLTRSSPGYAKSSRHSVLSSGTSLKVVFDNYGRPLRGYGPTDGGTYVMYKNITIFVKQMLDARDQQLAEMKMAMTQL